MERFADLENSHKILGLIRSACPKGPNVTEETKGSDGSLFHFQATQQGRRAEGFSGQLN